MQRDIQKKLYTATFLTDFALGLLIFAVSRQLAERGAGLTYLGVAGSVLSFAWAMSSVLFGRLSDHFGRKKLICCGIICLFASGVGCALFCSHTYLMLAFYWLSGIAGGMIYPPIIAWLNRGQDSTGTRSQATGTLIRFCLAWNLGLVSGQFSAGFCFAFDSRLPLYLSALLSVVNLAVMLKTDGSTELQFPQKLPNPKQVTSVLFARISWIANLSGSFATGLVLHLFPSLAVTLGVPPDSHGTMLALMRVVIIGTYLTMHHITFWHHRFSITVLAHLVGLSGLLILTRAVSQAGLTVGLSFLGLLLGFNYFASLYYSITSSHQRRKGLAGGIHEATLGLGIAAGSLVGGIAGTFMGPRTPYWVSAFILIGLFVVQVCMYLRGNKSVPTS